MKHIFDADMNPIIKTIIKELKVIENYGELDYIYTTFSYIFEAGDVKNLEEFREIVKTELSEKDEENIMTLASRLRQEGRQAGHHEGWRSGRQEGMQEGMQQGMQKGEEKALKKVALTLLRKQKPVAEIEEVTGLPAEKIKELELELT
jgi:predicted transposase/invertase (TIGR01784 family)